MNPQHGNNERVLYRTYLNDLLYIVAYFRADNEEVRRARRGCLLFVSAFTFVFWLSVAAILFYFWFVK